MARDLGARALMSEVPDILVVGGRMRIDEMPTATRFLLLHRPHPSTWVDAWWDAGHGLEVHHEVNGAADERGPAWELEAVYQVPRERVPEVVAALELPVSSSIPATLAAISHDEPRVRTLLDALRSMDPTVTVFHRLVID